MSSKTSLQDYGKFIKIYRGNGEIHQTNNIAFSCQFECGQSTDGWIFCRCFFEAKEDLSEYINFCTDNGSILLGHSEEGFEICLTGLPPWIDAPGSMPPWIGAPGSIATFLARDLTVKSRECVNPSQIKFHVGNFEFIVPLRWNLDDHDVTITQVKDYGYRAEVMQITKKAEITAEMSIKPHSSREVLDLPRVKSLAEDICRLLSLARGCNVHYLYWEMFSDTGQLVKSYYQTTQVTSITNYELICENPREDVQEFIGEAFDNFRKEKIDGIWDLNEVIQHYIDSISAKEWTDLRALKLVTLVDYLIGRYAEHNNMVYFIEKDTFKKKNDKLRKKLKEILLDGRFSETDLVNKEEIFEDVINGMAEKVKEINRRSFSTLLKELLYSLNLWIETEEIQKFTRIRNKLVHEARFFKVGEKVGEGNRTNVEDARQQYFRIISFVDHILLAILRYPGYYYDWHTGELNEWAGPQRVGRRKMSYLYIGPFQ